MRKFALLMSKSYKEIQAKQGNIWAATLQTKSDQVFLPNKGSLRAENTPTTTRKFISALMTSKLGKIILSYVNFLCICAAAIRTISFSFNFMLWA